MQEIPRSRRGGYLLNHTFTVSLLNRDKLPTSTIICGNDRDEFVTGGQDNTLLVHNLTVGGVYNVCVQAFNGKGPSPVTCNILRVRSSPREYC